MSEPTQKHSEILADLLAQNISEEELILLYNDLNYILAPTEFDEQVRLSVTVGNSFYIEAPEQRLN